MSKIIKLNPAYKMSGVKKNVIYSLSENKKISLTAMPFRGVACLPVGRGGRKKAPHTTYRFILRRFINYPLRQKDII